jgi:hypothetical protein
MKIAEYQDLLATTISRTASSAPVNTPQGRTGQSIIRMASAYESDGRTFLSGDDPVNALAAFLYGLGWIHCGIASGSLVDSGERPACPFASPAEKIPDSYYHKLDEKTGRYAHLLTTAIASVSPAPAPGTPAHTFSCQVLFIAEVYLKRGNSDASLGRAEEGLSCFSYGHGWLDAGVEAGLFAIHAHREIFTVD